MEKHNSSSSSQDSWDKAFMMMTMTMMTTMTAFIVFCYVAFEKVQLLTSKHVFPIIHTCKNIGEQLFDACACDGALTADVRMGAGDVRFGGDGTLPLDGCRDNSGDVVLFPDTVGIPIRSENG